jgi:hypothetical protein
VIDVQYDQDMDFDDAVAKLMSVMQVTMGIDVIGEVSEEDARLIERANEVLRSNIGREHAARRVVADDAAKSSEDGMEWIKAGAVMGFLNGPIQLISSAVALGLGGFGDDLAVAKGEGDMLRQAGIPSEELKAYWKVVVGSGIALILLASQLQKIREMAGPDFGPPAEGFAYEVGATGMGLSLAVFAVNLLANHAEQLTREGKLPNHVYLPELATEIQESGGAIDVTQAKELLVTKLTESIEDEATLAIRLREVESLTTVKDIVRYCSLPGVIERVKLGGKELITINEVRGGIIYGELLALILGPTVVEYLLPTVQEASHYGWEEIVKALAYTYAGGIEVPIGLGYVAWVRKAKAPREWKKWLLSEAKRITELRRNGELGSLEVYQPGM